MKKEERVKLAKAYINNTEDVYIDGLISRNNRIWRNVLFIFCLMFTFAYCSKPPVLVKQQGPTTIIITDSTNLDRDVIRHFRKGND